MKNLSFIIIALLVFPLAMRAEIKINNEQRNALSNVNFYIHSTMGDVEDLEVDCNACASLVVSEVDKDSIPSIKSYFNESTSIPSSMGKIYDKGLKLVLKNKTEKAESYFYKVAEKYKNGSQQRGYASYQLMHLRSFGTFDTYFNGMPSNIERTNVNNIQYYTTNNSRALDVISSIPEYSSYNLRRAISRAVSHFSSSDEETVMFAKSMLQSACAENIKNEYNLYDFFSPGLYMDEIDLKDVEQLMKVLPFISRMEQTEKVEDIGKSASELYKLGIKRLNDKKYDEAFYFFCRSAFWGDYEAYSKIFETAYLYNTNKSWYDKNSLYKNRTLLASMRDLAKRMCSSQLLSPFKEVSEKYFEHYNKEYEKIKSEIRKYERAKEEERRQQRAQAWAGVFQVLGEAALTTLNQMQQYNAAKSISSYTANPSLMANVNKSSANLANMSYLLNPMYAVAQVNAKEYEEYRAAREGYQRMTGKDLSMDEWRAMQGAAIMKMKEEGYDIIAENRKLHEQQKADQAVARQKDKEAWFQRMGYDISSSSTSNANATKDVSQSSSSTSSVSVNRSGSSASQANNVNQSEKDDETKLDAKQQYKNDPVSSDDYHYEKKVTLYIRDANTNRVMFSNKDLCKKGAQYFVKIDNKYYLVNIQGGWGFNSSILYSSSKLYFNM